MVVSGSVRDFGGEPIGGATVLVPGGRPVTTGSDGRFSISGVGTPYDIAVIVPGPNAVAPNSAVIYQGLTRSNPSLLSPYFTGPTRAATIGGMAPPASGKTTLVFFLSDPVTGAVVAADPATGQYAMTVSWQGSATTQSGQLYLLRIGGPSPWNYDGFVSKALTINGGGDFPGKDFAETELADPPEHTISGTVAVPAGYTLNEQHVILTFGGPTLTIVAAQGLLSSDFTQMVPDIGGLASGVAFLASDPASRLSYFFKREVSGNPLNITVPLEPAGRLAVPVDGATAVDVASPFSWTQGGGTGVNVVEVFPDNSTNPTFFVFTTRADATIPDLSSVGMGLPGNAGYHWHVVRFIPIASVDEAATLEFVRSLDLGAGDIGQTVSERFRFTTAAVAGTALPVAALGEATAGAPAEQEPGWIRRPVALFASPR